MTFRSNALNTPGLVATVAYDAEMAAFEGLGPQTRRAISEAPLQVLARPIYDQVSTAGLNPLEIELDARLAAAVRALVRATLTKDRGAVEADAGMRPLRPRRKLR